MPTIPPYRFDAAAIAAPITLYDVNGNAILVNTGSNAVRLGATGGSIGFYGTTPIALQTGVAVTAAGVHAACVALGLFTA